MADHIVHPSPVFFLLLFFCKLPAAAAHFCKAYIVAIVDIILERYCCTGTKLIQNIAEIGISYGFFCLNNGIIVIQYQTFVFEHKGHHPIGLTAGPKA